MLPIIIECTGIRVKQAPEGLLSAGVERLRDQLMQEISRDPARAMLASPIKFILDHIGSFSDNNIQMEYNQLLELELESIREYLGAKEYHQLLETTNLWSFVKRLQSMSASARVWVVKPLLADVCADELWLFVKPSVDSPPKRKPSEYIDFLYLIYSRGLYYLSLVGTQSAVYGSILKEYWEYVKKFLEVAGGHKKSVNV